MTKLTAFIVSMLIITSPIILLVMYYLYCFLLSWLIRRSEPDPEQSLDEMIEDWMKTTKHSREKERIRELESGRAKIIVNPDLEGYDEVKLN